MFIVTGATGQLGRNIVKSLVRLVPAGEIAATCRDPDKAKDLAALGVQVRQGDFADPESLGPAFAGAHQVLIVSSNARAHGGDTPGQHSNALAAARSAGAQRIVYTSHMAVSTTSAFPPMHDHAATEEMLRHCGMAWTALRHGFYGASGVGMLMPALETGVLDTAQDGPVSWTAHADLAEAAAHYLTQTSLESGPTPPLTGSEALDLGNLAGIASELLGKTITRHIHSGDDLPAKLITRGMPETVANIMLGFYTASSNGEFATVDPTLGKVLGRPPIRMHELIAAKIDS